MSAERKHEIEKRKERFTMMAGLIGNLVPAPSAARNRKSFP